jgi:hypothetical protein
MNISQVINVVINFPDKRRSLDQYSSLAEFSFSFNIILLTNSVALVRERTIPNELPTLVGKVSANVCG